MRLDIENMSNYQILNYILKASYAEKKEIFEDNKIYAYILKSENIYIFNSLLESLEGKEILLFCNRKMISYLNDDELLLERLENILLCPNVYINEFLTCDDIISMISRNIKCLSFSFSKHNFSEEFITKLFAFVITYIPDDISEVFKFPSDIIKTLISKYYPLILEKCDLKKLLYAINGEKLSILINYDSIYNEFINLPNDIIDLKLMEGLKFSYINDNFIDKIVNINDVNTYRKIITDLEVNNYFIAQKIHVIRKNKYLKEFTKITDEKDMFEVTTDLFFEDFPYNVFKNVMNMLNFLKTIDKEIIPLNRVNIYKDIYNYHYLSYDDKVKIFYSLSEMNIMEDFYDDMRACKDYSASLIKNSLLEGEKLNKLYSKKLSKKYDNEVYVLDGQPFYLLITVTKRDKAFAQYTPLTVNAETSSFSLISEKNINTFSSPWDNIVLGFNYFDEGRVMHIFEDDAFTNYKKGSKLISKLYTPNDLMEKTNSYNEILYNNVYYIKDKEITIPLKPSYVVCYDEISVGALSAAKLHNIPIILINTSDYMIKNDEVLMHSDDDKEFLARLKLPEDDYYIPKNLGK